MSLLVYLLPIHRKFTPGPWTDKAKSGKTKVYVVRKDINLFSCRKRGRNGHADGVVGNSKFLYISNIK